MKNIKIIPVKQALFAFLFCIAINANAQKLPTEQQVSLRAPADLKIDGKATEWDNKFQAYNHHTDFYYTIANDDNNLYLIVQAPEPAIIKRILKGGITFTINKTGKKDDKDGMGITYPIFEKNNRFSVIFINKPKIVQGSAASVMQADSFMNATNNTMAAKAKMIKVTGIKNVDTLISVYNDVGIKAAALFDNNLTYTYELAVSLKNLGMSANTPQKFAYNLRINAVASQGITIIRNDASGSGGSINITGTRDTRVIGQDATDFWGEYTLAKE